MDEKKCKHCGIPFKGDGEFCCRGCEYVYHLIREEGLDRYYELKDRTLPPVGSTAFRQRDDRVLQEKWRNAEEIAPGEVSMEFELKGISCVGCVWLVEKLFSRYEHTIRIDIDPQRGKIVIDAGKAFDIAAFAAEIQRYGYTLREAGEGTDDRERTGISSRIGVCGFLAMNVMLFNLPFYLGMENDNQFAPLLRFVVMVLSSFSVLYGGSYFFRRAATALKVGVLHIDLPIALGIIAAYAGSFIGWLTSDPSLFYFDFIAIFILLMLVGRWFQERVTEQNMQQGSRADPSVQQVILVTEGNEVLLESERVHRLEAGMRYRLEPGAWVPVRSRVLSGNLSVSLESINGESDPQEFSAEQTVPSGAVVLSQGDYILEATEGWKQSLLKRLTGIDSARIQEKGVMEQVLRIYILAVIVMAVAGLLGWGIGAGHWKTGFQVAVSILVVSCPCAIGLAYPRVNDLCAQWLRNRGVYIRLHSFWGRLKGIRQVFFDKTGTLTLETLDLINPEPLEALNVEKQQILYGLVENNLHPVARSLKEHLLTMQPMLLRASVALPQPKEQVGFGVFFEWQGATYSLAKSSHPDRLGNTDFTRNGEVVASFRFSDSVRSDARDAIRWMESHGYRVSVISGDSREKVREMMQQLDLPEERGVGGMSPEAKAEWIDRYANEEGMMVGDGANDALAFEKARCRATPVIGRGILENHSDFFFLGKGIGGVVDVFRLAALRQRAVREILTLTVVYNLVVVGVSLGGHMNPLLAAVLMPVISVITISWASVRLSKPALDRLPSKQSISDQA